MIESEHDVTDPPECMEVGSNDDVRCPLAAGSLRLDMYDKGVRQSLTVGGCPLAANVEERVRFESLLSELSSKFVNLAANEVDSQIEAGLRRIVELLGIDRSGLGEVSADGRQFIVTHSYQLPGVPPSAKLILHSQFPNYTAMIRQGTVIRRRPELTYRSSGTAQAVRCRNTGGLAPFRYIAIR